VVAALHAARSAVARDRARRGGIVVVVLLVFLTGPVQRRRNPHPHHRGPVARAEQQVRELAGRAPTTGVDPGAR